MALFNEIQSNTKRSREEDNSNPSASLSHHPGADTAESPTELKHKKPKEAANPSKSSPAIEDTTNANNSTKPNSDATTTTTTNSDNSNSNNSVVDPTNNQTSKDYYFDSYSHHGIHEEMLKDTVRTQTYRNAILENPQLFKNKVVLDVGCGTGILSMFAAQAGAKHVYAIDCSTIIRQAQIIIEKNGFGDKITLIQGKVEEVELPVENVDIIISEWMGYFLLYESMLDTVLFARDKWLVPENGIIFPDKAVMYIAAVEDASVKRERIDFWENVYGFDMSNIRDIAIREPVVDVIEAKNIVSNTIPILKIDILTCTKEDLEFSSRFKLTANRNDYVHGLVVYFECAFTQVHKPIGFSTSPFSQYTHWKQTIFYLKDRITIHRGEDIKGQISCKPNERNNRDLDIELEIQVDTQDCKIQSSMLYNLR
jgi:protein arginine N-methyltransferase 1